MNGPPAAAGGARRSTPRPDAADDAAVTDGSGAAMRSTDALQAANRVLAARLKECEQRLFDCESELRIVTSAVPVGIARIDRDLRYRFVNAAYLRSLSKRNADDVIGQPMAEILGDAAFKVVLGRLEQVLAGWTVDFEAVRPTPSGPRHIHATYVPEYDEQNAIRGFVAVIEDITERKISQSRLHEREREFKTLSENAPDAIARLDRELRYLYLNRAAETAFDVRAEQCAGLTAPELGFPDRYVVATTDMVIEVFARAAECSASFSIDSPSANEIRHFVARGVPEFDRDGAIESVLLIVYDFSERMRTQHERDRLLDSEHLARRQAEAAARSRDEFLAIVSHELRSPLNGIQSWAHVLESQWRRPVDAPADASALLARRAVAGIRTGVEQQVRLIDDLLDATRIVAGKLSLSLGPLLLTPIVLAAAASVDVRAREKRIEFHVDLALADAMLDGDADRLQQIVWNLLSNAIKFTPAGGNVWLSGRCGEDSSGAHAVIRVRDDGRGIRGDFIPHLFDRFQRDETGNSRGHDGLGLGLMLVRHLCERHGGSVAAHSLGPGQGATFTVSLPLRADAAAAPSACAQPAPLSGLPGLDGARLMLVDDHHEARDSLAVLLVQAGAVVDGIESGDEAARRFEPDSSWPRPDVLICDIAMPGTDGYETLRRIRLTERLAGSDPVPAIALTAFAQNEDRIRAHDAGFVMHLAKPVMVGELIATIAALVRHRQSG